MKTNFILFISAVIVTFSLIAALQFTPMPWFFLVLLFMHFGVFLFIFSKKRFRREGLEVGKYYKREYILLALYLPILLSKALQNFGIISLNEQIKTAIVLILSGACIVLSAINAVLLYRDITKIEKTEKEI